MRDHNSGHKTQTTWLLAVSLFLVAANLAVVGAGVYIYLQRAALQQAFEAVVLRGLATSLSQSVLFSEGSVLDWQIDEMVTVDASIPINETVSIPLRTLIPVQTNIPVQVSLPISRTFDIPINTSLPVNTVLEIPVELPGVGNVIATVPIVTELPIDVVDRKSVV